MIDLRMYMCTCTLLNTYHNYYNNFIGARTTKATSFLGNEKCRRKFDAIQHYHRSMILLSRVMLGWREETIS